MNDPIGPAISLSMAALAEWARLSRSAPPDRVLEPRVQEEIYAAGDALVRWLTENGARRSLPPEVGNVVRNLALRGLKSAMSIARELEDADLVPPVKKQPAQPRVEMYLRAMSDVYVGHAMDKIDEIAKGIEGVKVEFNRSHWGAGRSSHGANIEFVVQGSADQVTLLLALIRAEYGSESLGTGSAPRR